MLGCSAGQHIGQTTIYCKRPADVVVSRVSDQLVNKFASSSVLPL